MAKAKDPALIKGEDLLIKGVYRKVELTIKSASIATRDNESGTKEGLLIYFDGAQKPFFAPTDQVNYRMIKAELGTVAPPEMVGKQLTLIPVVGDWFGDKNVLAARVLVTGDKPKPKVGKKAFGESVVGLKVFHQVEPSQPQNAKQ